jgi:DNA/RNA-binding domain of Phe-tRNA-synthetase-like protein
MKYTVDSWVFEHVPNVRFGIIVARGLKNTPTSEADSALLSEKEALLRQRIPSDQLKQHPDVALYRDALQRAGINPNKFMNSVEAMSKRIVKGSDLPRINALVDLCNAVAIGEMVSLGAHDLRDIDADLAVRLSEEGDCFLPFGETSFEAVKPGELVFTSGNKIQTRQWLWRQSELGKITESSSDIFFQLVGFEGDHCERLTNAMDAVINLIETRFGGEYQRFMLDKAHTCIEFE